tara:strand:- start:228 stop:986 length:759 start_codon:yes stop_codon:yes gene_type:complete
MASIAALVMSQLRGKLGQIYRDRSSDGGTLTDITAGVVGARTGYEGYKSVVNTLSPFKESYMEGKYQDSPNSLQSRVGEKFYGPYSKENSSMYFKEQFDAGKLDPKYEEDKDGSLLYSLYDQSSNKMVDTNLNAKIFGDDVPKKPDLPRSGDGKSFTSPDIITRPDGKKVKMVNYGSGTVEVGSAGYDLLEQQKKNNQVEDDMFMKQLNDEVVNMYLLNTENIQYNNLGQQQKVSFKPIGPSGWNTNPEGEY